MSPQELLKLKLIISSYCGAIFFVFWGPPCFAIGIVSLPIPRNIRISFVLGVDLNNSSFCILEHLVFHSFPLQICPSVSFE